MTILGVHDLHERGIGTVGWMVDVVYTGHDANQRGGPDYRWWRDLGVQVVCRLDDGQGTIPLPQHYDAFAQRCANVVADSQGCDYWVIGNEFGNAIERPPGAVITTADYIACYRAVWAAVKAVRPDAQLAPAALGPWNTETGDWLQMYKDVLETVEADWLCWHVYSHGYDPALVTSEQTMDAPYQSRHYHFRIHLDWLAWTPHDKRTLPVIVTEANGNGPWESTGWIQAAYDEIQTSEMDVLGMCLFRAAQAGDGWAMTEGAWSELENVEIGGEIPVGDNLLVNPSFEGEYHAQDGDGPIQVADGWRAFWWPRDTLPLWAVSGGSSGPIRRPEFKALPRSIDAGRVLDGDQSQCFFAFYSVMLAGVMQTVNVPLGSFVLGGVNAQTWTSANDDPKQSTGEMYVTVGIDPKGGSDPWARRVQWADWQPPSYDWNKWRIVESPIVEAYENRVTVFIMAHHKWAVKHGDVYLDAARLEVVDLGSVPIEPPPDPDPPPVGEAVDYARIKADTLAALAEWDRR